MNLDEMDQLRERLRRAELIRGAILALDQDLMELLDEDKGFAVISARCGYTGLALKASSWGEGHELFGPLWKDFRAAAVEIWRRHSVRLTQELESL